MTVEVERVASKVKDILFPVKEWGSKKTRLIGVSMMTAALGVWIVGAVVLENKPENESEILKEKETM